MPERVSRAAVVALVLACAPSGTAAELQVLPAATAAADVGYELKVNGRVRGETNVRAQWRFLAWRQWTFDARAGLEVPIRENPGVIGAESIQPDTIYFPLWAMIGYAFAPGLHGGAFAHHRSHHNIDSFDARLDAETMAYEQYGLWGQANPLRDLWFFAAAGPYVNRPTNHLIAGAKLAAAWDFFAFAGKGTVGAQGIVDIHAAERGSRDLGLSAFAQIHAGWRGEVGTPRVFLRTWRMEDYLRYGSPPEWVLVTGFEVVFAAGDALPAFSRL